MKIQRRSIFTVPQEMAQECPETPLGQVAGRLGQSLRQGAGHWIEVRRKEGEDYIDAEDIHVYGPYPSAEMLEALVASEHMAIGQRERAQLVRGTGAFAHYLLVANFKVGREPAQKGATYGKTAILSA